MVSQKLAAVASTFPDPAELERRLRIVTIIEAVTDAGDFCHYYYSNTNSNSHFRHAYFDSGSGDHARIIFGDHLTFIRAFDHESYLNPWVRGRIWPGILHNMPNQFRQFMVHDSGEITAALWHVGIGWDHGDPEPLPNGQEPDPTFWMFSDVVNVVDDFSAHAVAEGFSIHTGIEIHPEAMRPFLYEQPLTQRIIQLVNSDARPKYIHEVATTAGYPSQL